MDKEKQILKYMESLKLTREEAEQLWEDDQEDYIGEEGEAMQEKAKEVRRYEKSEKPKTPRKPREKKVDEDKKKIVEILANALTTAGYDAIITNVDKEISIGELFTVNLVKHRPKKEKGK